MLPAPFSHDPEAAALRAAIDSTDRITVAMAEANTAGRPVRIYADGVFDLFHEGHANALLQAKNLFPHVHLIAGVCGDEETRRIKGPTVLTEQERFEIVRNCRYVDEVYCRSPFTFDMDFVREMKICLLIDFVAHDALPYPVSGETADVYQCFRDAGIFIETKRTHGVSTTEIIARVLDNIDGYTMRNKLKEALSRKALKAFNNVPLRKLK